MNRRLALGVSYGAIGNSNLVNVTKSSTMLQSKQSALSVHVAYDIQVLWDINL
jgi:hypothetical protein